MLVVLFAINSPTPKSFNVKDVSVSDAKTLLGGGAIVVDVRGEEAYGGRHIAGALLVPLAQLQAAIPAALAGAKDRPIVVYCNDGMNSGPEGTQTLNKAGYSGAVNLKAGIEGWEKAGFPIEGNRSSRTVDAQSPPHRDPHRVYWLGPASV
jgi:rhodanese-related sulfurtransferase